MLKIVQFSQIHKYNYKKELNRTLSFLTNKKKNFLEKNIKQTQGRKLTNLRFPQKWWSNLLQHALTFFNVSIAFL